MKKKLLYIGHAYHNKTKSTQFLQTMFHSYYDVTVFDFDPYNNGSEIYQNLKGNIFDIVVCFQILPDRQILNQNIIFRRGVFFPMYDGGPDRTSPIWDDYRDFQIINFSKKMHEELISMGLSSHYIQYFPKPIDISDEGDEHSLFFWQRIECINISTVEELIRESSITHIYLHHAVDPSQKFISPSPTLAPKVTISKWFEHKKDLLDLLGSCAFYIAPRPTEGIGMSFLEAMAMGRCVIAPDNPTMNEYIKHGETGLLFDYISPEPLDLSKCRAIQRNAQAFMAAGFSRWQKDKLRIIDWLESPLTTKIRIVVDATIFFSSTDSYEALIESRTMAEEILRQCSSIPDISVAFYCLSTQKSALENYLDQHNISFSLIYNEYSDIEKIDIFISPTITISERILKSPHIITYAFISDLAQIIHQDFVANKSIYTSMESNNKRRYLVTSNDIKQKLCHYCPSIKEEHVYVISFSPSPTEKCEDTLASIIDKYNIPNLPYIIAFSEWDYCNYLSNALSAFAFHEDPWPFTFILVGNISHEFRCALETALCNKKNFLYLIDNIPEKELAILCHNAIGCILSPEFYGYGILRKKIDTWGGKIISIFSSLPSVSQYYSKDLYVNIYKNIYNLSYIQAKNNSDVHIMPDSNIFIQRVIKELENPLPTVTIITVIKNIIRNNRQEVFQQCLQSVWSQNYAGKVEHLIMDGASTDGTSELLSALSEQYDITFFSQTDDGIYDAMNKGLEKASGAFVCFLNSDDFFSCPDAIASSIRAILRTGSDFSSADAVIIEDGPSLTATPWSGNLLRWLTGNYPCHQTFFCKREALLALGGFDTHNSPLSADNDLMCRLYCSGYHYIYLSKEIVNFRAGGASAASMESIIRNRQEHIHRVFRFYGKQNGLSLADCARFPELAANAAQGDTFLLLLRVNDPKLVRCYLQAPTAEAKAIIINPPPKNNFRSTLFFRLFRYYLLSRLLRGRRKKHYQKKLALLINS